MVSKQSLTFEEPANKRRFGKRESDLIAIGMMDELRDRAFVFVNSCTFKMSTVQSKIQIAIVIPRTSCGHHHEAPAVAASFGEADGASESVGGFPASDFDWAGSGVGGMRSSKSPGRNFSSFSCDAVHKSFCNGWLLLASPTRIPVACMTRTTFFSVSKTFSFWNSNPG